MSYFIEQIAVERQRIAVFESKIEKCKKRIESLEFLIQDSEDELDTLASNTSIDTNKNTAKVSSNQSEGSYVRKKPINSNTLTLLRFIGTDGKSIKDMVAYAKTHNLGLSDQNIRNFAMKYRKLYCLLDNPHTGFYRLNSDGVNAIKAA